MIQGTASNVGKSILTAGLCRIFAQDGYKVAPFKSQNMALNSAITEDGLEMGRAQVVQAQACGIAPSVDMNPILLKPTGDTGSQVIVHGVPRGVMKARDYYQYKKILKDDVLASFSRLEAEYDLIVIEGAGSPAEINLKADDFVNMGLAKMLQSPVLLVGDIDRGGVFASLYGTVKLLELEEQNLISGLIINKFRGDPEILRSGLAPLEEMTGKKIFGVVPMIDVDIDDEDSLSSRLFKKEKRGMLDIAVIRLPRLSNFTDFNPLERYEELQVRYVSKARELGKPDLLILPGTKSTMSDLLWLKESGFSSKIQQFSDSGGAILGICGGYQMLGEIISDAEGVEGGGSMEGLGLLKTQTLFRNEKTRSQVAGKVGKLEGIFASMTGIPFQGYEIHMGETFTDTESCLEFTTQSGEKKRDGSSSGNVWGCYVHGIFEKGEFTSALLACLLTAKGLSAELATIDWESYANQQYDILAENLRKSLDMQEIYRIVQDSTR